MSIVTVNVSAQVAPLPSLLQKKGAFISQGATTTAPGTLTPLQSLANLTAILNGALALSTLTWTTNVVSATAAAPHGVPNGQNFGVVISGATPSGYNGSFIATSTGTTTFTYPLGSNPGVETIPGSYTLEDVGELTAMGTTFFNQGAQRAAFVLELGAGDAAHGVTALQTWINNNPGTLYAYLVPKYWADEASYWSFLGNFNSLGAKTYFHTTANLSNYANFTPQMKCAFVTVQAPAAPPTEFSAAAGFYSLLANDPSATNKVGPTCYRYLYGVTPYPTSGNAVTLAALAAANVNVVGTGAEGGISNLILLNGTTMDGKDFSYWYSVDWVQINIDRNVSAAVINGSNNNQNPLYYNQDGINRLQAVIAGVMNQGVSFGLVNGLPLQLQLNPAEFLANSNAQKYAGQTPVNAQPFFAYSQANPNDFGNGLYTGFAVSYTPTTGFKNIVVNVNVTQFVAS